MKGKFTNGDAFSANDLFMFVIGVPLVLGWIFLSAYVIYMGINNPDILTNLEGYTTLIAILGAPALLIIKDALDVWKQEQTAETRLLKNEQKHYHECETIELENGNGKL